MHSTHDFTQIVPLLGGCFIFFIASIVLVFTAVIYCKIFAKAGYHWAMGLLTFVPIANIIVWLMLAFCEWPIQKELQTLRQSSRV